MKTRFTIKTANGLPDGSFMVSGSVEGPFLTLTDKGRQGTAATTAGNIKVELTGIGVINPNFLTKERQGILLKILEGNGILVEGVTLDFGEQPQEKSEAPNAEN